MIVFIVVGVLGGVFGALFIKASRIWARTFRRIPAIKKYPLLEVFLVALITGLVSFWNKYTRFPVAELLYELASPCNAFTSSGNGLCPTEENIPHVIWYLGVAFVVKSLLTVVTFGLKLPAGIYVPSMVVGGLFGRMVGHMVQYLTLTYPHWGVFSACPANGNPESCVTPGVYALVAAGATMCGVTRLSVTLAVILFELTGSLEHVLPFSIGVLVSKWTADALEPLSIYVSYHCVPCPRHTTNKIPGSSYRYERVPLSGRQVTPAIHGGLGRHHTKVESRTHHRRVCDPPCTRQPAPQSARLHAHGRRARRRPPPHQRREPGRHPPWSGPRICARPPRPARRRRIMSDEEHTVASTRIAFRSRGARGRRCR